jgi:hypothetical protein
LPPLNTTPRSCLVAAMVCCFWEMGRWEDGLAVHLKEKVNGR